MRKPSNPIPFLEGFRDGVAHFLNYAGKVTAYDRAIIALGIESRPVRRIECDCFGADQDVVVPELGDWKWSKNGLAGPFAQETIVLLEHYRYRSQSWF